MHHFSRKKIDPTIPNLIAKIKIRKTKLLLTLLPLLDNSIIQ